MALNLSMANQREELKPRITVFGVGGAGGNAVNNMIAQALEGVEFVVANTDAQALQQSKATARIQMGTKVTEGLGAGARPSVGAAAAEEAIEEIVDHLAGAHMCFITAGMGGGTGTGAAPIIAQAARELGVLTVGVVTKPFQFEGAKRMRQAEEGLEALQKVVDTLIIIPNQNLFRLANERTTFTEAFAMADDVLYQGVKGVTDLMVRPGLINLDFADVRAVMDEMGKAMMGTGDGEGENRAIHAAEKAIANPLLDEISLNGAKGVLINITGGNDLTLFELDEAANIIREKVDPEANIIVGSTLDTSMEGRLRVSVVATGIDATASNRAEPAVPRRSLTAPMQLQQPAAAPAPVAQQSAAQSTQPSYQQPAAQQAAPQQPAYQPQAPQYAPNQGYAPAPNYQQAAPQPQPAPQYAPQPQVAQHQAPQYQAPQHQAPQSQNHAWNQQPEPEQVYHQQSEPQQYHAPVEEPQHHVSYEPQPAPSQQPWADENELPAPAYRPQARAPQQPARHVPAGLDGNAADFVAPRPRAPGQSSPEVLQRLQEAVSRSPGVGAAQQQQPRAAAPAAQQPAAAPRPRFGIGSLINRMSGHGDQPAASAQPAPRSQPPVTSYDDEVEQGGEPDRIEIPAFLRRQAN